MMRALNTASTGMAAQQTNIDVIANNMANVNTNGFRRSRAEFEDLLYQTVRAPGGAAGGGATLPTGLQIGQGTRTVATSQIHAQGTLEQTNNPLDLAIEGSGFFQVRQPSGELAFTRAGNLKVDAQGTLVTVDGFPIEPSITIPSDALSISIAPAGVVSVVLPGQTTAQEVGTVQLASFSNPAGLQALGRNLFRPSNASGEPIVGNPGEQGIGTIA